MAHIPAEELFRMIDSAKQKVTVDGTYYHYKHPEQHYTLVDVIIIEATDEIGILYRAEYDLLKGITFMRPIEDFLADVDVEGEVKPRFTLVK
jgi:hypothetical protein